MAEYQDSELEAVKQELRDSYTAMHAAITAAGIYYFEYFPEEGYALQYQGRETFSLDERLENYPESWFARKITHPEDESRLREAFRQMKEGAADAGCEVRNQLEGQYRWFRYRFTSVYGAGGVRKKVVCTAQDISESKELERRQEELNESNAMYELTTKHAHMNLWMYDIAHDVMYNTLSSIEAHPGEQEISGFVNLAISRGLIRQDSISDFLSLYEQLQRGAESLTADIWLRTRNGRGWWCERITYVTVFDENHRPYKAFGLGRDVTDFKEAELRLEAEKAFQDNAEEENLILKTRCNLTTDRVERLKTKPDMAAEEPADTFTGGVAQVADNAYSEEDRRLVLKLLSREHLEDALKEGNSYTFEYQRRDRKGHPSWTKVSVRVLYHPETQDLIGFVHMYDINAERKMASIINRIAMVDYEVLALIYVKTDEMEAIRCKNPGEGEKMEEYSSYSRGMRRYMEHYPFL